MGQSWTKRASALLFLGGLAITAAAVAGCGPELDLGSDIIWTARHEGGDLEEWRQAPGGGASANPPPSLIEISNEQAHRGGASVKLSLNAPADGVQYNAGLSRTDIFLPEAYYSAWYYLPRSVTVGGYWVIFKIRKRDIIDNPSSDGELFDIELTHLPSGEMTLFLYDHRSGDVPLAVPPPIVPVGRWFHIEAFYRNAPDTTGRMTVWLDGALVVDVTGKPTGPTPWMHWVACSVAIDLAPSNEVLYVDDAAISLSRVGPQGIIGR